MCEEEDLEIVFEESNDDYPMEEVEEELSATPLLCRAGRSTRTFFYHGPEESKYSSFPLGSFSTHSFPSRRSPLRKFREIALRGFAAHANNVHMPHETPTSDGQRVSLPTIGIFPIGKIGNRAVTNSLLSNSPNPESRSTVTWVPLCLRVPHCHVTSGVSRVANPSLQSFCCWKPRVPGSRCSGFVPRVHTRIDGLDQIGRSHLAISMCVKSLLSPTPIYRYATARDLPLPEG
jgi:hypothetical protein